MPKLLVVDDEPSICWGLSRLGESIGHQVVTASSAEQALRLVRQDRPDVIVLDVRLPGMDGLTAIERLRELAGQVPIIVVTAYGDLPTAIEAVRNGAFEYLVKPFDLEQVQRALQRALDSRRPAAGDAPPIASVQEGLIGKSAAMQEVFKRIALAAVSDTCVLLEGESGTGKELAARAIHRYSARSNGPFVAVNVAALSPTLVESELFGHLPGAFTGATHRRTGLLVHADGGTLFLDEVADIPLAVQVKLLRAVEHGEVVPVGSNEAVRSNFRVIAATHQRLPDRVQQGTFRHDLYFRLSAFRIPLPALRDRREDIAELVRHFVQLLGGGQGGRPGVSAQAMAELERRPWYGNVRELRNAVEHALIVARGGTVMPDHLPPPAPATLVPTGEERQQRAAELAGAVRRWAESKLATASGTGQLYEQLLQAVEPPLLQAAMNRNRHQCATAARALGLHRTTLKKKLRQYGIGPE